MWQACGVHELALLSVDVRVSTTLLQHDRVCSIVKSVMATTNDILHTLESNANDTSVSPSW
jgi:hypothetical protein